MSDHKPTTTKEIPAQGWEEWCDTFSNGNRGRSFGIHLVDDEVSLWVQPNLPGCRAFWFIDSRKEKS